MYTCTHTCNTYIHMRLLLNRVFPPSFHWSCAVAVPQTFSCSSRAFIKTGGEGSLKRRQKKNIT